MNLARCNKGHYYDGDKYIGCPHCVVKDNMASDTVRKVDSIDTEQTEPKRTIQGKALKDAVLDALEKKRESEVAQLRMSKDETVHLFPVGMLVAVGGVCKGSIYVLKEGSNYIGVCNEVLVASYDTEKLTAINAIITYHEERQMFVLKPLGEEPVVRVGRMVLRESIMLRAYDKVVVQDDVLLFVPICGEHFKWE